METFVAGVNPRAERGPEVMVVGGPDFFTRPCSREPEWKALEGDGNETDSRPRFIRENTMGRNQWGTIVRRWGSVLMLCRGKPNEEILGGTVEGGRGGGG